MEFYVDLRGTVLGKNFDSNIEMVLSKHNIHINITWAAKE
jgi:hypothetical protein